MPTWVFPLLRYGLPVLALAGLVWGAYGWAWDHGHDACDQAHQVALAQSIERAGREARAIALQDAEISAGFESERERIHTVYKDREIEVTRYVPADCVQCRLGGLGLGLLNDALGNSKNRAPSDPGKPDYSLPRPVPPAGSYLPNAGFEAYGRERKIL